MAEAPEEMIDKNMENDDVQENESEQDSNEVKSNQEQKEQDLNEANDLIEESESVVVQPAEFDSLSPDKSSDLNGIKMDHLMNLVLNVSIELGRTEMFIKDILELGIGSIIELNKLVGEPVDLLINNKKFAEAEVVVIDENFGVRITNLMNPIEAKQQLANDALKKSK